MTLSQFLYRFGNIPTIFWVQLFILIFFSISIGKLITLLNRLFQLILWAGFVISIGIISENLYAVLIGGSLAGLNYLSLKRQLQNDIKQNPFQTPLDPVLPHLTPPPLTLSSNPIELNQLKTAEVEIEEKHLAEDGYPQSFRWKIQVVKRLPITLRAFYFIFNPLYFSLALGRCFRRKISCILIPWFSRKHKVDLTRFCPPSSRNRSNQKNTYRSFDDFFTRCLKEPLSFFEGAAPCEGKLVYLSRGQKDQTLQIKGETLSIQALVGESIYQRLPDFLGVMIIYLSPRDYHRGASPFTGTVLETKRIPGLVWTVQPEIWNEPNIAGQSGSHYLTFNTRDVVCKNTHYGLQVSIYVAATNVFSTEIHTHAGAPIKAGQHEQTYHLGSTNVYLFDASQLTIAPNLYPGKMLEFGITPLWIPKTASNVK